jgi:hypothetical protein
MVKFFDGSSHAYRKTIAGFSLAFGAKTQCVTRAASSHRLDEYYSPRGSVKFLFLGFAAGWRASNIRLMLSGVA